VKKVRPFYLVILVILFSILGVLIYVAYFYKHSIKEQEASAKLRIELNDIELKHGLIQKVLKEAGEESKK
jgi:hypothetical protein